MGQRMLLVCACACAYMWIPIMLALSAVMWTTRHCTVSMHVFVYVFMRSSEHCHVHTSERVTLWCWVAKEAERGINTVTAGDCIPCRTTHVWKATIGWDQSAYQSTSGGPGIYEACRMGRALCIVLPLAASYYEYCSASAGFSFSQWLTVKTLINQLAGLRTEGCMCLM